MTLALLPEPIIALARRVIEENKALGRTVVVAESCTGGLVAAALTEIPGSSAVLDRGYVTYSNEAKASDLGVSEDLIDAFGAVSIACVYAMARGALERSGADVAVAISGIAGPDGGSEHRPVGTVMFARAVRGDAV
ncbi:MAG: CinA family protein, partial [Croceibacterium sp.]